jgi:hypothetical protein
MVPLSMIMSNEFKHRVLSKYSNCLKSLAESDWARLDRSSLTWSTCCRVAEL